MFGFRVILTLNSIPALPTMTLLSESVQGRLLFAIPKKGSKDSYTPLDPITDARIVSAGRLYDSCMKLLVGASALSSGVDCRNGDIETKI